MRTRPRGVSRHLRTEKARIRRMIQDPSARSRALMELVGRYPKAARKTA